MQKSRKKQGQFHNRPNIALRLAAILLMLVCLSVWLMNGLFAKYRTSDEGSDSARVISFGELSLDEKGDFIDGEGPLIPGVDLIKDVTVKFTGSESSTYVFVEVDLPEGYWTRTAGAGDSGDVFEALSDRISWEVAGGWTYLPQETEQSPYIYYCEVKPNTALNRKFIAGYNREDLNAKGVIKVDKTITRQDMADIEDYEIPISINLRAIVVQSNGFTSPLEAWQSVDGKID